MNPADRSPSIQADEIGRLIRERGWSLVETYIEGSGSRSFARRPESVRLIQDARRNAFDIVVVWRADRLFTGIRNMVATIDELTALGIHFVSTTEPFNTLGPDGHHFIRFVSALAELESQVPAERTRAGLDAARRRGSRIGRPRVDVDVQRALELKGSGKSLRETARILGVGAATLHRALKNRT